MVTDCISEYWLFGYWNPTEYSISNYASYTMNIRRYFVSYRIDENTDVGHIPSRIMMCFEY